MKTTLRKLSLLLCYSFFYGCAYKTTIYSPNAITTSDHTQGDTIFIYRDEFIANFWAYEWERLTVVRIQFSTLSEPAAFSTSEFYIDSGGKRFNLISTVESRQEPKETGSTASLEIHQGEVLVLEFPKEALEASSFTLHIPTIKTGNGQAVSKLDSLTFKKKRVWRAISIN